MVSNKSLFIIEFSIRNLFLRFLFIFKIKFYTNFLIFKAGQKHNYKNYNNKNI